METYSTFSDLCTKFYDLVIDPKEVAKFVYSTISERSLKKVLFVGSFFLVAKELEALGLDLVVVDYSAAMIKEARLRLPTTRLEVADLRDLPFEQEFDVVLVVGRVFTHMLTDDDASRALSGIHRALTSDGVVFLDNYEDSLIRRTSYFNGKIAVKDSNLEIVRASKTTLRSEKPFIVDWSAEYRATSAGVTRTFSDEMPHRAFSRDEMKLLLREHGFVVTRQGDNFDETSFYTVAVRTS